MNAAIPFSAPRANSPLRFVIDPLAVGASVHFLDWEFDTPSEGDLLVRLGIRARFHRHAERDLRFATFTGPAEAPAAAAFWHEPFARFKLEEIQRILGALFPALGSGAALAVRSADFADLDPGTSDARHSLFRQSGFAPAGKLSAGDASAPVWLFTRV